MSTVGCFQINNKNTILERIAIVIPARLDSERLPKKVLLEISGLPMIEHVRRRGLLNSYSVPVFVASGDDQIREVVESFGGQCIKTFLDHEDGLSRVNEASSSLNYDYFIILQGDEILALPSQIDQLIEAIVLSPEIKVWNQITSLSTQAELQNTNIVKCLIDHSGKIFSIFRHSPLTSKTELQIGLVWKICGLFCLSKIALNEICQKENGVLQSAESIEQLKFIEYGFEINSVQTQHNFTSINTIEDVLKVRELLSQSPLQIETLSDVLSFKS
jgi:3-deoxy-manno-octulosonate cytidylyltransferase (CMP-KDO synthetase)